jgi:outer membrane protein TolC
LLIGAGALWPGAGAEAPAGGGAAPTVSVLECVRLTLAQDPNIRLQERQVQVARGLWQSASGQFDPTLETSASRGRTQSPISAADRIEKNLRGKAPDLIEDVANYRLGLSQQLRSGPTITPSFDVTRLADNQDREAAVNLTKFTFTVKVPLLRGRGRAATAAGERAAEINHEAAILELRHTVAARILQSVSAYWECLAAREELEVLRASEARATELVGRVSELIRAGEMAAADSEQAQADQAEKGSARLAGEQQFFATRQNLGLAMGLGAAQLGAAPLPGDGFPQPPGETNLPAFDGGALFERSLARRADYQAALKAEQAAGILLAAARNGTKPQLDMSLEAGYTSLDEGSQFRRIFGSLDPWNSPGPSVVGSLRLEWPFGNRAARGLLAQREAAYDQTTLRTQDLARNIHSSIAVAWRDLESAIGQVRKAGEAASGYRQAVEHEREKLGLGNSTVIDAITIADRLANTERQRIAAQAHYATALVRVRFETGLLAPAGAAPEGSVEAGDLVTLPADRLSGSAPNQPESPKR